MRVITFISDDPNEEDTGTPQSWYDAVVTAKGGNAEAVVVLGLTPYDGGTAGAHWHDLRDISELPPSTGVSPRAMTLASLLPLLALAAGLGSLRAPGIDQDRVEQVVADRRVGLSVCYEDGRDRNPKLQGNVGVVMEVAESGRVESAKSTRATTINDKEVVSCVLEVMKTLDFGQQEKPQTVRYTVRFFEEPPAKDE